MMRKSWIFRLTGMLMAMTVFLTVGCFSLGVSEMSEYVARFPEVYVASWELYSPKKIQMSTMVGDGSEDHSANLDELERRVDEDDYRMLWVNVSDADGKYPSSTISEVAFYLASTDGKDKTINFNVFCVHSDPLPIKFNISNIIGSERNDIYENGQIISYLPEDISVLYSGSVTLKKQWTDVYFEFAEKVKLDSGDRLVVSFTENNDYIVSVTQRAGIKQTTENTGYPVYEYVEDEHGIITKVQKIDSNGDLLYYKPVYDYKFSRYSDNDFSFSVDKVLLYVDE